MPAILEKIVNDGYRVRTPEGITAKHTTKKKGQKQVRLLNAIAHGFVPTGKK